MERTMNVSQGWSSYEESEENKRRKLEKILKFKTQKIP